MRTRRYLSAAAIIGLLVAAITGCASDTAEPEPPAADPPPASAEAAATWISGGEAIALITWGSSSIDCIPTAQEATENGTALTVELIDPPADAVCTADYAPRATYVSVPQNFDTAEGATLSFSGLGLSGQVSLPQRALTPGAGGEGEPSASWFAPGGLVLLTWGSSTCPPVVEGIGDTAEGARVSFKTDENQVCTMDFVPRLTLLQVTAPASTEGYVLTLVGGNLDGAVTVEG